MVLTVNRKRRIAMSNKTQRVKTRAGIIVYKPLIDAPHNLGDITDDGAQFPLVLPANIRLALSCSQDLAIEDVTVKIGAVRRFSSPDALLANEVYPGEFGYEKKTLDVTNNTGITGGISILVVDDFGRYYVIATGTLSDGGGPDDILDDDGNPIEDDDGNPIQED